MIFLAKTALEEFIDYDKNIVFLGEWCTINLLDSTEYKTFSYIWNSPKKIDRHVEYSWKVYDEVLNVLVDFFNNYHGVKKDKRYWEIIIGNWLFSFIHVILDRYLTLKSFIREYPSFDTIVLSPESYVTPIEFNDFSNKIIKDEYNLQLYSQILSFMGYKFTSKKYQTEQSLIFKKNKASSFSSIFFKLLNLCTKQDARITLTAPYFYNKFNSYIKLLFASNGQIKFDDFNDEYYFQFSKNRNKKLFANLYKGKSSFIHLLFDLFEINFPILFLEGYSDFLSFVKEKKLSRHKSDMYITSVALHDNYLYKFYLAENIEEIKIASIQHGGYGVGKTNSAELYERKISDYFFTWGWKENTYTIPLANERLSGGVVHNKNGYILYTLTDMPKYVYRIQNSYNSSSFITSYIPKAISFLSNINDKDKFILRVNTSAYGMNPIARIKKTFAQITIDENSKNFRKTLEGARLCVTDHMHTTFIETLAMNFPTVIFIDDQYYSFRKPDVIKYLEEAQILFYDEKKAAKHINKISDNIESWWLSESVQEARNNFCNEYAIISKNWADDWKNEFNKRLNNHE